MNPNDQWRLLAEQFYSIGCLVSLNSLPEDYQPKDLEQALARECLSRTQRSVANFLLHIWNRSYFSFDLGQIVDWDSDDKKALGDWFNGGTLGVRCRYF